MPQLRSFDAREINDLVSMSAAITVLRDCFAKRPSHIARQQYGVAGGEFLLMPAVDADAAGIKLIMVQPKNAERGKPIIQGTYVLFDAEAGSPLALLDGAALTTIRTPAVSAVATDALARTEVNTLGIIGSGPQAFGHIEAMLCVRPTLNSIVLASRTRANAQSLADNLAARGALPAGVSIRVGDYAQAAACDIVCTGTRATEPILNAAMVSPGTHINAVGSYRTDMRELSTDLVAASTVVVDDLHAAHDEAGDLELAAADGGWNWDRVAGDLAAVAAGQLRRQNDAEITFFKSVGLAVQDLVIARHVCAAAGLL
jgi:ornithine cyclodeaminase